MENLISAEDEYLFALHNLIIANAAQEDDLPKVIHILDFVVDAEIESVDCRLRPCVDALKRCSAASTKLEWPVATDGRDRGTKRVSDLGSLIMSIHDSLSEGGSSLETETLRTITRTWLSEKDGSNRRAEAL